MKKYRWPFFFFLYLFLLLVFLKTPFEIVTYQEYVGSMIESKKAILISSEMLQKETCQIDYQLYSFSILNQRKEKGNYLIQIVFDKKQPKKNFLLYCKKNRESIWKLIQKEWR